MIPLRSDPPCKDARADDETCLDLRDRLPRRAGRQDAAGHPAVRERPQPAHGFVFLAAAGALVVAAGLAVLVGNYAARYLEALLLNLIAAIGFIALGGWSILEHFRS